MPCNGPIVTPIEGVQICHILIVQLEVVDGGIRHDSFWVRAFGQG